MDSDYWRSLQTVPLGMLMVITINFCGLYMFLPIVVGIRRMEFEDILYVSGDRTVLNCGL
jgi:hypothetical protein